MSEDRPRYGWESDFPPCRSTPPAKVRLSSVRGANRQLVWVARDGAEESVLTATELNSPRLSPEGTRIVFTESTRGVMSYDIGRDVTTVVSNVGLYPIWTPDGTAVVLPDPRAPAPDDQAPRRRGRGDRHQELADRAA